MRVCEECGKEIPEKSRRNKRFCSNNCRARIASRIYHSNMKDDKEYKEKKSRCFKKWYKNNYEHFKDLVRVPNKIKSRERVKERLQKNLCIYCGKEKPQLKKGRFLRGCEKCMARHREYSINKKLKKDGSI